MSFKKTWKLYPLYKTTSPKGTEMSSTDLVVLRLQQLRSRRLGFGLSIALNAFALLKL